MQETRGHAHDHLPVALAEVDLSGPVPGIRAQSGRSQRVRVLVRMHSQPLGIIDTALPATGLDPTSLRDAIWESLSTQIRRHLASESQEPMDGIPLEGFGTTGQELCSWRAFVAASPPRATIVVNTCGGREMLLRTISSALDQDYPNFEVVVVDNRPCTSQVERLLRERFPGELRLGYASEPRPGLGRARNAGLQAATSDLVAFTDDDVVLDKSWLSWLVAGFGVTENVDCVTGLILPLELETQAQLLFDDFNGWSTRLERRVWDRDEHRLDHPLYPYTVGIYGSGANAAFRRQALLELGGFDHRLGIGTPTCGGEDLDIYTRIILRGHRLVYQPAALLRHAHPRDLRRLEQRVRFYGVGLGAMLTKHLCHEHVTRRELLRRLPAGLVYTFSPRSLKNARKPRGYPLRLTLYELMGMAWGPIGYLRSRLGRP